MSAAPAIKIRLKYRLKIVSGPHQNEIHTLDKDVNKIGRGDDNTIRLPRDGRISRNHMEIIWTGSEFKIKNLSQKNFVMLNERVIQEEVLKPGAKLQIGETLIEVFEDGPILVPKNEKQNEELAPLPLTPATGAQVTPLVQIKSDPSQAPAAKSQSAFITPTPGIKLYPPAPSVYSAPAKKMGYSAPRNSKKPPRNSYQSQKSGSKSTFYIIAFAIIGLVVWLATRPTEVKEKLTFRSSQQVEYDRLQVEAEKLKLEERLSSQNNQLVRQSQENLVKGFRDYQQGNYMRAKENFASVLIKDPDNELAKRYYHLSGIKFDELLQFNILQGLRYREKKNYRLCRSSFQSALVMIQNNNRHPKYNEIKEYFDECNLGLEGRF
jgi:pSer/pThr/pTyr-binding forkhead associated (FHA) protein